MKVPITGFPFLHGERTKCPCGGPGLKPIIDPRFKAPAPAGLASGTAWCCWGPLQVFGCRGSSFIGCSRCLRAQGVQMNIRGFLSRALIALSIALGAGGASQAQPTRDWLAAMPDHHVVAMEMSNDVVNQLAGKTFWERFLTKSSWGKVGTRVGTGCFMGALAYVAIDRATQHNTWHTTVLRSIGGCAAAATGQAALELTTAVLLAAGAAANVVVAGGIVIGLIVASSVEIGAELIWQKHTLANGMAKVSGDGRTATIPRRRLNFVDEEYFDYTPQPAFATNLKHPNARTKNGINLKGGRTAGNQWVGGYQVSRNPNGCPSNPALC